MYNIRFNGYLTEYIFGRCRAEAECLWEISENIKGCAHSMDNLSGFGIEDIICDIHREAVYTEHIADDMLKAGSVIRQITGIYEQADVRVRELAEELPAAQYGSISGSVSHVMAEPVMITPDIKAVCSLLLCDNTVVHEDWLTVLMAENKFGG